MEFELRPWRIEDAPSLVKQASNAAIASNMKETLPAPYTLGNAVAYISRILDQNARHLQICRAIAINGEAVGSIGAFQKSGIYGHSAEVLLWLGQDYWNHGIGTSALSRLCSEAFSTLGVSRLYAEPFLRSKASCRVLEKAGFKLEGVLKSSICKDGELLDTCIYAQLK